MVFSDITGNYRIARKLNSITPLFDVTTKINALEWYDGHLYSADDDTVYKWTENGTLVNSITLVEPKKIFPHSNPLRITALGVSVDGFFIQWEEVLITPSRNPHQIISFYQNGSTTETTQLMLNLTTQKGGLYVNGKSIFIISNGDISGKTLGTIYQLPYSTTATINFNNATNSINLKRHLEAVHVNGSITFALTNDKNVIFTTKTSSFFSAFYLVMGLSSLSDYTEGGLAVKDTDTMFVGFDSSPTVYRIDNYSAIKKVKSNYNIMNFASNVIIAKYNIINIIIKILAGKYDILNVIYNSLTGKYDTFIYTIKDITGKNSIFNFVQNDVIGKYGMSGIVSNVISGKYNIINRVASVITFKYSILNFISKKITGSYNIFNFVSKKVIAKYSIFDTDPLASARRMFLRLYDRQRPVYLKALD